MEDCRETQYFKCASCHERFTDDFCSDDDITICRWCSGEEKGYNVDIIIDKSILKMANTLK